MNTAKRKAIIHIAGVFILCVGLISCASKKQAAPAVVNDTPNSGTIHISVDESFKPVIDEQIMAFEGSFPHAKIIAHYKPEAECLRDILKDSATRMAIVTRGLSEKEEKYFDFLEN